MYSEVKSFFDLPEDIKQGYEIEGLGGQRGYISFGKEHAKGKKEGDLKEFWHFGQEAEADANLIEEYPENVTVKELENFSLILALLLLTTSIALQPSTYPESSF